MATVESHRDKVSAAAHRAARATVARVVAEVEVAMKQQLDTMVYSQPEPRGYKRTGNLMSSVQQELSQDGSTGTVEATAEYAAAVHNGTAHTRARPYAKAAADQVLPGVHTILAEKLREELAR